MWGQDFVKCGTYVLAPLRLSAVDASFSQSLSQASKTTCWILLESLLKPSNLRV